MEETENKKKIKTIYKEFKAYLSQMPLPDSPNAVFYDKSEWEYINEAINRLNTVSGKSYEQFKIIQSHDDAGYARQVKIATIRSKLGGLISTLHEEFFSEEVEPFSGNSKFPNMVINNQNTQHQTQHQQQEQKIELEQMLHTAQETIIEEYGKEKSDEAIDLIKKIIANPKNWAIIATSISGLLAIGKIAFAAALPIIGKILLSSAPVFTT